ncbi:MAG: SDR family oxidoreductase [Elusimicrobia bacterium]|nr:SDR family oxidoreductase [Elusimicrobiota bacterium]
MKLALLGGIGYIGGRLTEHLKSAGHRVRVTTRRAAHERPRWTVADEVVRNDLTRPDRIAPLLADRDVVIHLAAPDEIAAVRDPRAAIRAGGETVWNVLEAISRLPRRPAFLYLSTFHVYGQRGRGRVTEQTVPVPCHPYGLGRYLGENVTQVFRHRAGLRALCVRLSNVFGAPADISVPRWTLIVGDLCLQAVLNGRLVLRNPLSDRRNFLPMEDAVRGLAFLARRTASWPTDGVIHLGSPWNLTLGDLARRVARRAERLLGVRPPIGGPAPEARPTPVSPLRFSIDRVATMGFSWRNGIDREIDRTLRLCVEGYRRWGARLPAICGLDPGTATGDRRPQ